jgi:Reverse transcriptase (RNA-dependent DNA polymerase)
MTYWNRLRKRKSSVSYDVDAHIIDITNELKQMIKDKVWMLDINRNKLDCSDPNIPSFQPILENRDGGDKVRVTAGNYREDRFSNGGNESKWYSLSIDTLDVLLTIAVFEERFISRIDIVSAYHHCILPEKKYKQMKFEPEMVLIICELQDKYWEHVCLDDGCLYVTLQTTVYGASEFAELFYDFVKSILCAKLGFKVNMLDKCVFNSMTVNGNQLTVAIHVDHLLVTCVDNSDLCNFKKFLRDYLMNTIEYDDFDDVLTYLGVKLDKRDRGCAVDMIGYYAEIIDDDRELKKIKIDDDREYDKIKMVTVTDNVKDEDKSLIILTTMDRLFKKGNHDLHTWSSYFKNHELSNVTDNLFDVSRTFSWTQKLLGAQGYSPSTKLFGKLHIDYKNNVIVAM